MTTPPPYPPAPVFPPVLPKAPRATLSMVLGIVSVAGFFVLVVPVFAAPLAWYFGATAQREVAREPARWSGAGEARTGLVLGIVGTGLILLLVLVLLVLVGGMALISSYDAGYGT